MNKKFKRSIFLLFTLLFIAICSTTVNAASDIVVALDPGHGGTEVGAVGGNLVEKDLNWKLATRVKAILDKTPGIKAVLTKTETQTMDRETRAINAKNAGADLLVSFHINSNESSNSLSGAEVYITHSKAEKRFYEYSYRLGTDILSNLRGVGVRSYSNTPKTRVGADWDKYADGTVADYYGIISWPMHKGIPAVLIEHAFINNPYDRANYLTDAMLTKMAQADANAIIKNKELFRTNYVGTINTELKNINYTVSNGKNYIQGNVDIAEWVNGVCTTPKSTPKLTLKSTDGKISQEMFVSYKSGITYYFDRVIDNLDLNKQYYIEAKLVSSNNTASEASRTQTVKLTNKTLKSGYKGRILKITNNKIVFSGESYKGTINTEVPIASIIQNAKGRNYISGKIDIAEWVGGVCKTPQGTPKMTLKSTDGKYSESMYIKYESGIRYYFDRDIQDLDVSKTYYIEVKLTGSKNTATDKEKTQTAKWSKKGTIGTGTNGKKLTLSGNNIKVTDTSKYVGAINTELKQMNVIKNSKGQQYISGKIDIAEWVGGVCKTPQGLPKMTLKSTDGKYSKEMYVKYESGITYYYDRNIEGLDTSKTYYIEVKLTGSKNTASAATKTQNARCTKQGNIGTLKNGKKLTLSGNYIKFTK